MRKTEPVLASLILLSIIGKFFNLPGSDLIFITSTTLLSLMYCYLGFALLNGIRFRHILKREAYAGISARKIAGAVGTGMALSFGVIGLLFRILSLPGTQLNLVAASVFIGLVLLVSFVLYWRSKNTYYIPILTRLVIWGGLCLILYFMPDSVVKQLNPPAASNTEIRE